MSEKEHEEKLLQSIQSTPTQWNLSSREEGAYPPKGFNKVPQWEVLYWEPQLQPPGLADLLNCYLKTWVNNDYKRIERPSLVKAPFSV